MQCDDVQRAEVPQPAPPADTTHEFVPGCLEYSLCDLCWEEPNNPVHQQRAHAEPAHEFEPTWCQRCRRENNEPL